MAGASGFVGRRLCAALDQAGHEVSAMTRNPARYRGAGTPVRGDVQDPATLEPAMAGCQAAYYLVHSLQDADFEHKDASGATAFGEAAANPGLQRIIYLGGLGDDADNLLADLRSRRPGREPAWRWAACRSPSSGPGSSSGTAVSRGS